MFYKLQPQPIYSDESRPRRPMPEEPGLIEKFKRAVLNPPSFYVARKLQEGHDNLKGDYQKLRDQSLTVAFRYWVLRPEKMIEMAHRFRGIDIDMR